VVQQELLRNTAVKLIATHLSRSEPSLRREVVSYMLDKSFLKTKKKILFFKKRKPTFNFTSINLYSLTIIEMFAYLFRKKN
jgi:hypothetical protein